MHTHTCGCRRSAWLPKPRRLRRSRDTMTRSPCATRWTSGPPSPVALNQALQKYARSASTAQAVRRRRLHQQLQVQDPQRQPRLPIQMPLFRRLSPARLGQAARVLHSEVNRGPLLSWSAPVQFRRAVRLWHSLRWLQRWLQLPRHYMGETVLVGVGAQGARVGPAIANACRHVGVVRRPGPGGVGALRFEVASGPGHTFSVLQHVLSCIASTGHRQQPEILRLHRLCATVELALSSQRPRGRRVPGIVAA